MLAESVTGKSAHGRARRPDPRLGRAPSSSPARRWKRRWRWCEDYNRRKDIYKPEVIDSRLIGRNGDDFQIYMRLLKKKVITVVLDT